MTALPDIVQEEDNTSAQPHGAWFNPYTRPVIKSFPNGLAQPTTVNYVSTASAQGASTYKDDDTITEANTKAFPVPVTVVSNVQAEDGSGTGTFDLTTYTYHSMRQDSFGRGPLGFHRVEVSNQASNIRTVTTYAQAYPYTGMPTEVDKYQVVGSQSLQMSKTTTTYCDTSVAPPPAGLGCGTVSPGPIAPGTTTFVYPSEIKDIAYVTPGEFIDQIATTSDFVYDAFGNSTFTLTSTTKKEGSTTESFSKSVQNFYTTTEEQLEGWPDKTTILAGGGTKGTSHTTTFEYSPVSAFGGASTERDWLWRRSTSSLAPAGPFSSTRPTSMTSSGT